MFSPETTMKVDRNHEMPECRERVPLIAQVSMTGRIVRRRVWCPRIESEDQAKATWLPIFEITYFVECLRNHRTDISPSHRRVPLKTANPREQPNYQEPECFVLPPRVRTALAV